MSGKNLKYRQNMGRGRCSTSRVQSLQEHQHRRRRGKGKNRCRPTHWREHIKVRRSARIFHRLKRRNTSQSDSSSSSSSSSDDEAPERTPKQRQRVELEVLSIEFLRIENGRAHHTDEYEGPDGVVRRGQPFDLRLLLNRPFEKANDSLSIQLTVGETPQMNKGTEIHLHLSPTLPSGKWGACVKAMNDRHLTLSISSPPDCVIGRYELDCPKHCLTGEDGPVAKTHFYILFNPWCIDDTVYMECEKEKKEYILNETAQVYVGSASNISSRSWNFGQFEEGVLPICFELLDNSQMALTGRGNPITLCRVVSAMINSQDDDGLLEGNWSGDYSGGTPPMEWLGSVKILKEYHEKKKPVCYGQCWVFSAVMTTVMRSLGIPCRSVTNFDSAHDSDNSITIDEILDEYGNDVEDMKSDSVWNFHVWNDCWMKRPDLPDGYGGWQAIDATPQETSAGIYRCGPASLKAIKNGMVYLAYDTPFVFAEVNSDRIYWNQNKRGRLTPIWKVQNAVGHFISTQAVGGKERADVTDLYKFAEGSPEERIAVDTACKHGTRAQELGLQYVKDVTVVVQTDKDVFRGSKVPVLIILNNTAAEARQVAMVVRVLAIYYTGVKKGLCKEETFDVTLKPYSEHKTRLWLESSEYMELLQEHCALQCYVTGRVMETREPIISQHIFHLKEFSLLMSMKGAAKLKKESKVKVTFKNPLDKALKDVTLKTEGVGLKSDQVINIGTIAPGQEIQHEVVVVPKRAGPRTLLAILSCKEIVQVRGEVDIEVATG
uniref:protein-glutamine gamma-glutamyltransferase K-like n=1 Tax=Myxine glutinosa TaxID=7769 RepID=UPI00358F213A